MGQGEGSMTIVLRSEVQAFAEAMELKLIENDHKGGWKNESPSWLIGRLHGELKELVDAYNVRKTDPNSFEKRMALFGECVDVANFALFVADACGCLKK
jgi:hypothetical protein